MSEEIFGEAQDGTRFDANSPEVISYMEEYPDVSLEAAIGSVILNHNNGGSMPAEVEVSEEESDKVADEEAEAANEAAAEEVAAE